jgi:hypothetical protein
MQLNSYLFIFHYSKLIGGCDFVSFDEKNSYIGKFIYATTQTQVKLRFAWYICE